MASGMLLCACMPALGSTTSVWQTGCLLPAKAFQVGDNRYPPFFRWPEEVNVRAFSCVKSVASKSIKLWHKHFMKMRMKVTVRYLCKVCVSCMAVVVRYHLDNYTHIHTASLLQYYTGSKYISVVVGSSSRPCKHRVKYRALLIRATSNFKFGGIIFTKIVIEPRISPEASKTTLQ